MEAASEAADVSSFARDGPRVLVARSDHLGDLLLTLPAIRAVRRSIPDARITCLIPGGLSSIGERITDVDDVLVSPFVLGDEPPTPGSALADAVASRLRDRFDLAILARPSDPWSAVPIAAAGVPLRVGRPRPATLPYLTHAFPEVEARHAAREAATLALRAIALLGIERRSRGATRAPLLRLTDRDRKAAGRLLASHGLASARPLVVHPTAGWRVKSWPMDRWARVVTRLGRAVGAPVLVAGTSGDRELLGEIADRSGSYGEVVADVSLPVLAALHVRACAVVGMDSGALHLAASVGTPVVGLFGPFAPRRAAPLAPRSRLRAVWRALPCSPCENLDAPPCGAAHEPACLTAISDDAVVRAALDVIDLHVNPPQFTRGGGELTG